METEELIRLETLLRHRVSAGGRLQPRQGGAVVEVPRFVVHRYEGGYLTFSRSDLSRAVRSRLSELAPESTFESPARVFDILGRPRARSIERLYHLAERPSPEAATGVSRQGGHFVIFEETRPVAWAWTMEAHGRAEEGTVETVAEFRRHGLGRRALSAWGRHVLELGKVAFLAHPDEDTGAAGFLRSFPATAFSTRVTFP